MGFVLFYFLNFCYHYLKILKLEIYKNLRMQIRDKNDKVSEDYILQDNKKTRFGATFIIIVLIILIAAVAMTGVYFEYW